jgi:surface protein
LGKCEHFVDSDFYGSIYSDEIDLKKITKYKERDIVCSECDNCELRSLCIHLKCCTGVPHHCDEIDKKAIKARLNSKLTNVYNINTSNITDMRYMFYNCDNLDGSQFKDWDVSNVTTMFCMFRSSEFTSCLDLSSWNVSNTTSLSYMFNSCYVPYGIDISNWVLSSSVTTYMTFQNATCNGACKDLEHHVIHDGVSDNHWQRMKQGLY